VALAEGLKSSMGRRKDAKLSASSLLHLYFSIKTSCSFLGEGRGRERQIKVKS
jgi:hypothetical protein